METHLNRISLIVGLGALLLAQACATRFTVKSYPEGAKVKVQNVVSKEIFELGDAPQSFEYDPKYGEGFLVRVEKEQFQPEEVFLTANSGSDTSLRVNLKPMGDGQLADAGKNGDKDKKDDKKDPPQPPQDKKDKENELKERLAVLEKTFEIYKDALFSARLGSSPASTDRRKIDLSVGLVSKAQQLIEQRKLDDASQIIDKILEQDEYMSQGHIMKGSVAYLKGDFNAAIRSWERALEINPYEKLTRQYLVKAYEQLGRQVPGDPQELNMVDRVPAASPLAADPLKLRLRNR